MVMETYPWIGNDADKVSISMTIDKSLFRNATPEGFEILLMDNILSHCFGTIMFHGVCGENISERSRSESPEIPDHVPSPDHNIPVIVQGPPPTSDDDLDPLYPDPDISVENKSSKTNRRKRRTGVDEILENAANKLKMKSSFEASSNKFAEIVKEVPQQLSSNDFDSDNEPTNLQIDFEPMTIDANDEEKPTEYIFNKITDSESDLSAVNDLTDDKPVTSDNITHDESSGIADDNSSLSPTTSLDEDREEWQRPPVIQRCRSIDFKNFRLPNVADVDRPIDASLRLPISDLPSSREKKLDVYNGPHDLSLNKFKNEPPPPLQDMRLTAAYHRLLNPQYGINEFFNNVEVKPSLREQHFAQYNAMRMKAFSSFLSGNNSSIVPSDPATPSNLPPADSGSQQIIDSSSTSANRRKSNKNGIRSGDQVEGPKRHKCPLCPYASNNSGSIRNHIASIHSQDRPYVCPYCSYSCKLKGNHVKHIRARHAMPAFNT